MFKQMYRGLTIGEFFVYSIAWTIIMILFGLMVFELQNGSTSSNPDYDPRKDCVVQGTCGSR